VATLAIALKDLILDAERPVDLASLPEADAIAQIKKSYGFLSSSIEVTIQEGIAIITLPEEKAERASDALKLFDRALRSAQRGEYKRAIQQFQQVLAVLPAHAHARRNLGMAYEETGDIERAKDHVIEALKLNPSDALSYVVLGNIYMKHEKNYDRADKLYRRPPALQPAPPLRLLSPRPPA
jgi:tetratricopeptide (TPR) repeat protein